MNPIDTFSAIANPPEPDGKYYPMQPREQVPYTGNPLEYAYGPEHVFWRSVAPPPPPVVDPENPGGWTPPGSHWDGTGGPQGGGDEPGSTGPQTNPSSPKDGGLFANYDRPTLDKISKVAEVVTSPLGKLGSVFTPGGLLAQGLAHGAIAGVNRAKSFPRENKDTLMPSLLNPSLGGFGQPSSQPGPGGHNTQGGRPDRADKDGPQGGNGGGVGNASGEGPGGSAGMGDSEGAASGTWHQGGPVYDGNPQTYRQDMPIVAQEGEYVLPRYVVDAFGIDALDMLRKAVAPNGDLPYGSGEMKALPETLARHKPQR